MRKPRPAVREVQKGSDVNQTWKSPSFYMSLGLHVVLISLLLFTFENTIRLPDRMPEDQNKPIIDAVMINNHALQKEVERLDNLEKQKIEREKAREREIVKKEKEAIEKRKQEEALALDLKKKNEELKKQVEKQKQEEKIEKERLAKEKKRQEEELKKIQKQKEEALAQKQKIEAERKAAEESAQQQANIKIRQTALTQHAMLIKDKINRNWRQPLGFSLGGLNCELDVKLLPTGEVVRVVILKTSGNLEFDRSAELAVFKASPLPMPNDQDLAKEFRQFSFTFRPEVA